MTRADGRPSKEHRQPRGPGGAGLSRAGFLRLAGAGLATAVAGAPLVRAARPPLGDLARVTQGALITPGSGAYAAARQVANARFSGARPAAVLRARNVSDVRQAVLWCARNGCASRRARAATATPATPPSRAAWWSTSARSTASPCRPTGGPCKWARAPG